MQNETRKQQIHEQTREQQTGELENIVTCSYIYTDTIP